MKIYTHPKRKKTLIQRKDGRTYRKTWVYFRSLLRTENDEKAWNTKQSTSNSSWDSTFVAVTSEKTSKSSKVRLMFY